MKLYDITLPMQSSLALWPGDTPYDFHLVDKMSQGASINVGMVTMSVHTGTHADAPFHFLEGGATIDALDPALYIGPAFVVDLSGRPAIHCADIQDIDLTQTPRLLLKTNAWTDLTRFPETIPVMDADVPAYLQAQGVRLIGLDLPSVDALHSKDLPNHRALATCGIHILESLWLSEVPEGRYELLALPMKLVGADGAPVRALLRG
jgi:arylformamidase